MTEDYAYVWLDSEFYMYEIQYNTLMKVIHSDHYFIWFYSLGPVFCYSQIFFLPFLKILLLLNATIFSFAFLLWIISFCSFFAFTLLIPASFEFVHIVEILWVIM